ncbi:hypothetical protein [Anaerovorax odorimutans]|uniref:hypothetical protein n=1 Tax=Anaerovorax odorimutans TaxID=109327 RepID=UPI0003FC04EE|nr:hypothetical protein [Anaerovorax odorimutans]
MKILAEPIDTIVMFKGRERPIPYKFKYADYNGIRREIKIDKILYTEESKLAGEKAFIYSCQSFISNEQKRYELKYIVGECRWELYKM